MPFKGGDEWHTNDAVKRFCGGRVVGHQISRHTMKYEEILQWSPYKTQEYVSFSLVTKIEKKILEGKVKVRVEELHKSSSATSQIHGLKAV